MGKRGPRPGSGGGARKGAGKPRQFVRLAISPVTRQSLNVLALARGKNIEDVAATLLAEAVDAAWRALDEEWRNDQEHHD